MTALFAALLVAQAAPAPAAGAPKQTPPEAGPPKDFRVPAAHKLTLDNGLAVTFVQYGSTPKTTVALEVRAGNVEEAPNQVWLADLTGDMLVEGTRTRTAAQIAEQAANMGGSLNVAVSSDLAELAADVLSESAAEAVRLVADVARNPSFPEADFDHRKADRMRDLAIARAQPRQLAMEKFLSALYPDHPYGRILPKQEDLNALTVDQARAFHEKNFSAARSHLYVVGKFDEKQVEAAVRTAFSDWKKGAPAPDAKPSPRAQRAVYLVDRPGAVQSTLYVGMPVGADPSNPDYVKLVVTNSLLGGSFMSRITSNIREQKGYTYSPSSSVATHRRDAYWAETADVTTKDTGASLKEIFGEISRLQKEPPSAEELKGIAKYAAGVFVLQTSSRRGIVNQFRFVDLNGLPEDYLSTYVQRVNAVTPEDVQQMAAKYIQDGRAAIVVVGDLKVVKDQVATYGNIAD
ncbi:MAG: insulinase family protein [Deltaproteobacteria bacterium]|nr:MAG: insulinase family protein [Deltaproteobacteria bacterium]